MPGTKTTEPVTDTIGKAGRETWADWIRAVNPRFDEDDEEAVHLQPLDDLLAELNDLLPHEEDKVDAVTIRYWQREGILPYPIKRWHNGATRSLYPFPAAFQLILHIRGLQKEGYTLQQIVPRLRGHLAALYDPGPMGLRPAIDDAVREREKITGRPAKEVIVTFVDSEGWRVEYRFPIEQT